MKGIGDKQLNNSGNKRGMHPNSLKNLRSRWPKGHSGNPKGRPKKGDSVTEAIREELERIPTIEADGLDGRGRTFAQIIARKTVQLAAAGDDRARNAVLERTEGKVVQPVGGEGGEPIKTEIIVTSSAGKNLTQRIIDGERTE